jgi:hypothetical protein
LGHPEGDDADELDDAKSLLWIGEEFTGGPGRTARLVGIGIRGVKGPSMCKITYKVVKHDGGWAYEVNGTYSEPFPRAAARKAARLAASEQAAPGALLCLDIAADQQIIEASDAIPAVAVGLKHDAMLPVSGSSAMIF